MTRFAHTSRPRLTAVQVSLFPFLAVLICTMGALILLLVVIARQARLQATRTAAAEAQHHAEELQDELEMVQWRVEQLKASRAKTEEQLQQIRLLLGHLEDHARRLRQRLAELQQTLEQLRQLGTAGEQKRAELQAEYEALQAAVQAAEEQLDKSRKALAEKQPAYAIIPYQGPHGTRRRPIYVECRPDAVILQPEGVMLLPEDFEGPQGPGNPLAAALRAAREYLLMHQGFDPEKDGEPYPLLLVRPQGIIAYYAAREAMKSWGAEFGYELIGDDWKLAFPRADAELAEVMQRAVQSARAQQRLLAAAAPRPYGSASRPMFRVAPGTGGVIPDGPASPAASEQIASRGSGLGGSSWHGMSGSDSLAAGSQSLAPDPDQSSPELPYDRALAQAGVSGRAGGHYAAQSAAPFGSLGGGLPTGAARAGSGLIPPPGSSPAGHRGPVDSARMGNSAAGGGPPGAGNAPYPSGTSSAASGPNAEGAQGLHGFAGSPASDISGTNGAASGGGGPGATGSMAAGSSPAGQGAAAGSGGPACADTPGAQLAPGAGGMGPVGPASGAGGWDIGLGSSGTGSASSGTGPGSSRAPTAGWGTGPGNSPTSLAEARGRDWALPGVSAGAIAVVRPIRVDCYADRLVLVPEQGLGQSKTIMFTERTEAAIDQFVSAVWVYMQSWGMAGQGMYWRPVLSVRVAPGAEGRFAQLQALLEDSGLQVEHKTR